MKMKENTLKRRNEHLNYFLFSMRLYCKLVQKIKLKKKKLHDMLSNPLEKLIPST